MKEQQHLARTPRGPTHSTILYNNSIGNEGAAALEHEHLVDQPHSTIFIQWNSIGKEGAAVALSKNTSWTRLKTRFILSIGSAALNRGPTSLNYIYPITLLANEGAAAIKQRWPKINLLYCINV